MTGSIPVSLPIDERFRLLGFLKIRFQQGYFHKSKMNRLCREYGKDSRTVRKYLQSLVADGLVGENESTVYLRSWKFTTGKLRLNSQSFHVTLNEIQNREKYEAKQLAAKVTAIEKANRKRGGRVRKWGCTDQIYPSTGLLCKVGGLSAGKVTKLKRIASKNDFLIVAKSFEDLGPGSDYSAKLLLKDKAGIFVKDGRLMRRQCDRITSGIGTYRIKNRKGKINEKFNRNKA